MTTTEQDMKDKIIQNKSDVMPSRKYHWMSLLDFSKETSHVEHAIVRETVQEDYKVIKDALALMEQYIKMGVKFEDEINWLNHLVKNNTEIL